MRRYYGGLAMLLALVPAITIAGPATSIASDPVSGDSVPPADNALYDTFDAVTVNPVVGGVEQQVTGFLDVTATIDTSTFSVQSLESDEHAPPATLNRNGCSQSPPSYAGRTAWIRFNPGGKGVLKVRAVTSYDAVLMVREGTDRPFGQTSLTNLDGHSSDCSNQNANPTGGAEQVSTDPSTCVTAGCFVVSPDFNYFIQVGGRCPEVSPGVTSPSTCDPPTGVPGGSTQVQITFVPDDSDGDGIGDSVDACPSVPGPASAAGCPDADGDGIKDADDSCPALAGVPAAAPYNGCPAGPTPPDPGNPPYVTIVGPAGNLDTSNTTSVGLTLNWPQGAQTMRISNGDGVFTAPIRITSATYPWTLRPLTSSQSSASRDVKVVFQGPGIPDNAQDDSITLDTVRPAGVGGEFSAMARKGWHFFVTGKDSGTGVRRIQMLDRSRHVIDTKTFCTTHCSSTERVGLFSRSKKPVFARVVDLAGNQKVIRLQRSLASCAFPPYKVYRYNSTKSRCFALGDTCNPTPGVWDWRHADIALACRKVGDGHQVELR
ncbi:hypothetical protein ISU07_18935 [Nocardioides islandensis]|jgi:hypothetical protein|uniref:Uncharacterized protein n=1 Tax=Nocardioides islandensis TaxID=433663 RepID=A0A930VER2_9ACTN|nr:hypothetical protein [Nocardioides islandensis]MBF4765212.1 hypothetical protein [Nocardioides islandensis]